MTASFAALAPAFGIYVHVPFCSSLCPYCDFAVVVGRGELHARYCEALVEEARARDASEPAGSLFIGGGTPTLVEPAVLARAIRDISSCARLVSGAEVTVEANPDTVDEGSLATLRAAGVNRLSLGAQSFDDAVLRALGRTHDAAAVRRAVKAARAAGVANIGLDLIYGGPGESDESWTATLAQAAALGVEHVSCYALTIEERTVFGRAVARGRMVSPDEDALAARYETAVDVLAREGFEHYELSNWARPGFASRHNLLYWTQGEYAGLGLGAHSHRGGLRSWNTPSLKEYLAAPARARAGAEPLSEAERAAEWVWLRLRLVEGLDLSAATNRIGRPLDAEVARLQAARLLDLDRGVARLTTRGMLLENEVSRVLLGT